jgi:hypothetical protein
MIISLWVLIDNSTRIIYSGSHSDVVSYKDHFYKDDKDLKIIQLKGEY